MSKAPALSYFTRLSPSVYYLPRPTSAPAPSASNVAPVPALSTLAPSSPRLVILGTWMGAAPAHMDKYIEPYRVLFPTSPILVLRSETSDWLLPWKKPDMSAAADVVRSLFPESSSPSPASAISSAPSTSPASPSPSSPSSPSGESKPELVVHMWSNGGSASIARLRQALSANNTSMPAYTLVLDSTPSQFSYKATYSAFTLTAPKKWLWLARPLMHVLVSWFWILTYVRARLDFRRRREVQSTPSLAGEKAAQVAAKRKLVGPLALLAASHNAPSLVGTESRRTYIYSKTDQLIPYNDVLEHAADATAKGFDVRVEEFIGTAHVAHARSEPARYWEIVRETWVGSASETETKDEGPFADANEVRA